MKQQQKRRLLLWILLLSAFLLLLVAIRFNLSRSFFTHHREDVYPEVATFIIPADLRLPPYSGASDHFHSLPDSRESSSYHSSSSSSCLSRDYESRLRSPDQNIAIPPQLEAAWADYRHLHAACAGQLLPQSGEGAGLPHSNGSSTPATQRKRCQYLIYSDANDVGLGNRLLGLASALAFALATDRVILVDNRRNLADLLCDPFAAGGGPTWTLGGAALGFPELLREADMAESLGELWTRYGKAAAAGSGRKESGGDGAAPAFARAMARRRNANMVKVRLWDEPSDADLTIFTDGAYRAMADVRIVVWETDLYTIPNLLLVHEFWKKMTTAVAAVGQGAEDRVFAVLTRLALMPSNRVWAMVMREYVDYAAGARNLVGLQVRLHGGNDRAAFMETPYKAMLACLVNNSFLPPWLNIPADDRDGDAGNAAVAGDAAVQDEVAAGDAIQEYGRRVERREFAPDMVVAIASLQSQYYLRLKQDLSDAARRWRRLGGGGHATTRVHTVSSLQTQDFSLNQAEWAMAEMWLLSLAQKLATSASSTFGYAAHSWANVRPLILDFPAWRSLSPAHPQPECRVGYSTDPCSHLPRRPPWEAPPPHYEWLRRHLRRCQDRRGGGWQIVRSTVAAEEEVAPPVV